MGGTPKDVVERQLVHLRHDGIFDDLIAVA